MIGGWKTQELGDLATVGAGNSAPQDEALFADGTVPFFRTSDIGRIRFGDISTAADLLNERGARGLRRFAAGTILLPKSGASTFLNHRVMMQVDGCVSSHLATITAKPEAAEPRFLLHFLATVQAQDMVQDHAYPSLNLPLISTIKVPTPSLPEQRRIVAILDEAFEGIATAKAHAEKNLRNAREVFESHLKSFFDDAEAARWPRRTLREVASEFGRGKSKHRPRNDPVLYGGPYPFIQTGDVRGSDHLITEYTQTYSEAGLVQSKLWPKGTLCITIAANIAETGVLGFDACFPDSVIGVVVDEGQTSSKYIEYTGVRQFEPIFGCFGRVDRYGSRTYERSSGISVVAMCGVRCVGKGFVLPYTASCHVRQAHPLGRPHLRAARRVISRPFRPAPPADCHHAGSRR